MTVIEELRQNRESGAKRLEAEYKAGLMTLARRFCSDESEAAELVNRTFAAVVDGIDNYLEQSAFFGWMCQILSNIHAKDHRNKSNGIVVYPGEVPDMADEAAEDAVFRNIDRSLLREAVNGLPEDQRESVVLHYFLDIPIPKIAKILAVPGGTVKSRLHCARKALAVKLGVAVRKPGAKALLAVIALCALTAAGAAAVAAWNAAATANAECGTQNAECEDAANVMGRRSTPSGLLEGGGGETAGGSTARQTPSTFQPSTLQPSNRQTVKPSNQQENTMKTTTKLLAATVAAAASLTAAANPPWSDTPVTCHWIGAVKGGTATGGDFSFWTNQNNWAEGIVPGLAIVDGVTSGCRGCTAVFDRPCDYTAIAPLYGQVLAISNIVVSGSTVPKMTIGRPWAYRDPFLFLEPGGGIYIGEDVVEAPEVVAGIKYLRGDSGSTTTLYFENNSSTPLTLPGFSGPDVPFSSYAGVMTLSMRGTGDILETGNYARSQYDVAMRLEMEGGKLSQGYSATIDQILTCTDGMPQHFEIAEGISLSIANGSPVRADSDLLISGGGTCKFTSSVSSPAILAARSGKTITLDCAIERAAGGRFQIGWWSPRNAGTVRLAPGRSFGAPVEFFGGTLQLADGLTLADAIAIQDSRSGTICGGTDAEATIAGGVSGNTRPLTLKGRLAIASDITATTTLADDAVLSFRKAGDSSASFTVSSLKLTANAVIPVESGVTATIASIDNNGFNMDIRPKGTGKVRFTGLTPGRAPSWLTYKGGKARIESDGTLTGTEATYILVR